MRSLLRKTQAMTRSFLAHSFSLKPNSSSIISHSSRPLQIPFSKLSQVCSLSLSIIFVSIDCAVYVVSPFSLTNFVVTLVVRVFLGHIRALRFVGFAPSLALKLQACRIGSPFRILRSGKPLRSMRFSWVLSGSASTNWWLVLLLFASFF